MNKKVKRIMSTALIVATITSIVPNMSFANEEVSNQNIPGFTIIEKESSDAITVDGWLNSGIVRNKETWKIVDESEISLEIKNDKSNTYLYGLACFLNDEDKKDSVIHVDNFVSWLNENYSEFKSIFNNDLNTSNVLELQDAFEDANNLDSNAFAYAQQYYYLEKVVYPIIETIKNDTNIDFSKNRGLEELMFYITAKFGEDKTTELIKEIIKEYEINVDCNSEQIINKVKDGLSKRYKEFELSQGLKNSLISRLNQVTDSCLKLINSENSKSTFKNKDLIDVEFKQEDVKTNNTYEKTNVEQTNVTNIDAEQAINNTEGINAKIIALLEMILALFKQQS